MSHFGCCQKREKGIALILTLIFMVSLVIIVAAYLFMVTYDTRNAGAQFNNDKALYLADAGLNKAVWYLTNTAPDGSTDGSWRTTAYPANPGANPTDPQQESLGDGTYTIWVETSGSDIIVTAQGTVGNIVRTVRETMTLASGVPEAFNYVHFSGGKIDFKDSSGTVNGNLAAAVTVDNEGGITINGTITEGSSVPVPSVDLASYAAIAGTTVIGNRTFTSGTYNGIWYVDGRATINDNVTFNGTIIATGNIVLTNTDNFMSNPASNYPALVSGGRITGNKLATSTINGLLFAATSIDIDQGSNNTVNGSLISAGNIGLTKGSGWSITYDSDLADNPPPYFSAGSGSASGDGWQEI
ncbi:MAG: pilus assembly PilX N-terminal domain-containing protein [Candidatus Omnitrophica bacterium]|nr:pilus assembly PilX N-terminal domain-containing protein [Candidatus Omnitrophota bacterium]